MAIYGALGEGFTSTYGTRPGEFLSRGLGTFASAATKVITVPLPVRTVTHAIAVVKKTTDPGLYLTVGNYSGNTFTVYAWLPGFGIAATPNADQAFTAPATTVAYTSGTDGPAATNGEYLGIQTLGGATITVATLARSGGSGVLTVTAEFAALGSTVVLMPGDTITITYTGGTVKYTSFPFSGAAIGGGGAASSSDTFEWAAWGTL